MQQCSRFKPAGAQQRNVANRRNRFVRAEYDLEAVIQSESVFLPSALTTAEARTRLEKSKSFTRSLKFNGTRKARQSASYNGNHAANLIDLPQKKT
jgi:hypothetical protein